MGYGDFSKALFTLCRPEISSPFCFGLKVHIFLPQTVFYAISSSFFSEGKTTP